MFFLGQLLMALAISTSSYFVYRFLKIWKIARAVNAFPMEPKHWFYGHALQFPGLGDEGLAYYRYLTKKYPKAYGVWLGLFNPQIVVNHPETVKIVLKSSVTKPVENGLVMYGRYWLGESLLLAATEKWRRNRKLLNHVFSSEQLKKYTNIKNEACEILLDKLSYYADTGQYFEASELILPFTLDVILRSTLSHDSGVQLGKDDTNYLKLSKNLTHLWLKRTLQPWMHWEFIYRFSKDGQKFRKNADLIHTISEKYINDRRNIHESDPESKANPKDFLDVLLRATDEDGKQLTNIEIRDEVETFLLGGHDTTASAILWTLYALAQHPEHQKRCQNEIDDILFGRENDIINWNDLSKMDYLSMCYKEAMRLHASVPFVERELEQPVTLDGKHLPKGTPIQINIYSLHHNPEVWEDSMVFNPERFSKENFLNRDVFSFIPFSAGQRKCIGKAFAEDELKVILSRALKRFNFSLDQSKVATKKISIVIKAKDGIHLKVTKR